MAEQPMKVLVVSDVHGRVTPLRWLLKNETADALFFLGDGLYDLNQAIAANGAAPDYPIYRVRGNCDIGSDDPREASEMFHSTNSAQNPAFCGLWVHSLKTSDKVLKYGENNRVDFSEHPTVVKRGSVRTINIYAAVPDVA